MTEEKFIGYLRLVEACQASGCSVCRWVVHDSRSHLAAILREHVTDPETRRAVRASWGFCGWHTGMLPEIEHAPLRGRDHLRGSPAARSGAHGGTCRRAAPSPARAFDTLAGAGGVFGNDVHARRRA